MIRKFIIIILLMSLVTTSVAQATSSMRFIVNGEELSTNKLIIKYDKAYVDINTLASMVGALDKWTGVMTAGTASLQTSLANPLQSVIFYMNSSTMERVTNIDAQKKIEYFDLGEKCFKTKNGHIQIPLRAAYTILGFSIEWDSKTNTITAIGKIEY